MTETEKELLKVTNEYNKLKHEILKNGTDKQKIEILANEEKQRMINEEFALLQSIRMAHIQNTFGGRT